LRHVTTGPTGCGKTYLACALSHKACLQGFTSRYYRLPRLWHELKIAKADGSYSQWLAQTAKIDVLILDDWGLVALDDEQRRDILEILDDRYQRSMHQLRRYTKAVDRNCQLRFDKEVF